MTETTVIKLSDLTTITTVSSNDLIVVANTTDAYTITKDDFTNSLSFPSLVNTSQLAANLSNYQTTTGLSSNVAGLTANNSLFLGGVAADIYLTNAGSYTISGIFSYIANVVVNGAIIANNVPGSTGQVMTSNGAGGNVYWSTIPNTSSQYTWSNLHTFSNNVTFSASLLGNIINATSIAIGTSAAINSTSLTIGNTSITTYTQSQINILLSSL